MLYEVITDLNIQNERFGVDLVTFSHPEYWGVKTVDEMVQLANKDPKRFWTKMLDDISETGVTGIELTFAPFDWSSASEAFGGVEPFKDSLAQRGLKVTSGFFASFERTPNVADSAVKNALFEEAKAYAQFVQACDADVLSYNFV